jgi:hypothetical protein
MKKKKDLLVERFQQLAGIKPLYEIENESNKGWDWVDNNFESIPRFNSYPAFSNNSISSLEQDIRDYYKHVKENEDARDFGWFLGDNVVSHFKKYYKSLAENVGNSDLRKTFLNPSDMGDESTKSKYKDAVKAINFVNSLPETKDSQYLGNSQPFGKIEKAFNELFEAFSGTGNYEKGGTKRSELLYPTMVPLLVPYVLYLFKNIVWEKELGLKRTMFGKEKEK